MATQWTQCRGTFPFSRETRSGHVVTWIAQEWARSSTGSPLSFRTTIEVTFPDGHTVSFTGLDGYTPAEAVQRAELEESWNAPAR